MNNNILASGFPRYNFANLLENLKFGNESLAIGKNAGKNLNFTSVDKNSFNTILGTQAGYNSLSIANTILVGHKAGTNLYSGSNNIIIGGEDDKGKYEYLNETISLGILNKLNNNSIAVGSYNFNDGLLNIIYGYYNNILSSNSSYNIIIGNFNITSNASKNINIGNNNIINNNDTIFIGNNLSDNNYDINIGNAFARYKKTNEEKYVVIGDIINDYPVCIGYNDIKTLPITSTFFSLYVNSSIYTKNAIQIGNTSLIANSNSTSNISYILPDFIPDNSNFFLTSDIYGQLFWKNLNSINNIGSYSGIDIAASNVYSIIKNTDYLPEGTSNKYFDCNLVSFLINDDYDKKISNAAYDVLSNIEQMISLDELRNQAGNKIIKNGIISDNLIIFGTLIVNKLEIIDLISMDEITLYKYLEKLNSNITSNRIEMIDYNTLSSNFSNIIRIYNEVNDIKSNFNNISNEITTILLDFYSKINRLNLDEVTNGTSNKYIKNGVFLDNLMIYGKLTVNQLEILDLVNQNNIDNLLTNSINLNNQNNIWFLDNNKNVIYNGIGNVGINVLNPISKLHVNGNIITTGTITEFFSDIRLKEIIGNLENPLDCIKSLNTFKYKYNFLANSYGYTGNDIYIGMSAQEIQAQIPEVISLAPFDMKIDDKSEIVSKSGENFLTVNYSKLIPYLVECIKKLDDKIIDTSNELNKSNKKNDELEKRIDLLEKVIFKNVYQM